MKRYILSLITAIYVLIPPACSQTLRQPVAAVYLGLGAYSSQHADVFSFTNNQASLAQLNKAAAGIYGERRFLLKATSVYSAAVAIPSAMGNFGISVKYAGFKNYAENQIGIAYARSLGRKVAVGVQFNYYGYRVPSYNSASAFNFEIGALLHLSDKVHAGIHAYNPVGGTFLKTNEKLTSAYKLGLGYDVSERFFMSAEIVKEADFPVNINAGMQYRFMKQFFVRAGISSATAIAYAGAGIAWNNFRLDISGSYHPQLGISPGLLLIMNFGKKSNNYDNKN